VPNVVKGSKQEKMVVVPYRPGRRFVLVCLLVLSIGASAIGSFMFGYSNTLRSQQSEQATQQELSEQLIGAETENSELRRQVAILDRSSVMDQRATEEVQTTIIGLRDRVAQLEQDIVYYRQVVSAETEDTGLIISQLDIDATRESNRYRYKLVLRQQDADGDTSLIGHVNINLVGSQGEEQQILSLRDLSAEQDQLNIRLRFKYFQNIEGELVLPDNFVPDRLQVAAVSVEPVEKSINQNFSWVVER
jgi:competence protein ComGF